MHLDQIWKRNEFYSDLAPVTSEIFTSSAQATGYTSLMPDIENSSTLPAATDASIEATTTNGSDGFLSTDSVSLVADSTSLLTDSISDSVKLSSYGTATTSAGSATIIITTATNTSSEKSTIYSTSNSKTSNDVISSTYSNGVDLNANNKQIFMVYGLLSCSFLFSLL